MRSETWGWELVAAVGDGVRVRQRRGLQRHPARRRVLRTEQLGSARLVRIQQLLSAQWPGQRSVQLLWCRLRRLPATK